MLRRHAIPWWQTEDHKKQNDPGHSEFLTPDARAIWRWAAGLEDAAERKVAAPGEAHEFFRGVSASGTRHDAA
jgi:hypothetical protein